MRLPKISVNLMVNIKQKNWCIYKKTEWKLSFFYICFFFYRLAGWALLFSYQVKKVSKKPLVDCPFIFIISWYSLIFLFHSAILYSANQIIPKYNEELMSWQVYILQSKIEKYFWRRIYNRPKKIKTKKASADTLG